VPEAPSRGPRRRSRATGSPL